MVDLLEQLPLVAMSEMVDRERRHNEVVTSFCSGQSLARVVHGPKLETALFTREASARHPEHLHREINERHPRPRKLPGHHRAKESRPGPRKQAGSSTESNAAAAPCSQVWTCSGPGASRRFALVLSSAWYL